MRRWRRRKGFLVEVLQLLLLLVLVLLIVVVVVVLPNWQLWLWWLLFFVRQSRTVLPLRWRRCCIRRR